MILNISLKLFIKALFLLIYSGTFCELETNECLSAPCHNGGTCVDNRSSFYCLCQPDYAGLFCEQELNKCKFFVLLFL